MKYIDLKVGMAHQFKKKITTEDVYRFADLSGDMNPVHLDDDYAKQSIFGNKIVHGMLVGSIISRGIASYLPGPGSIYLHQSLNFIKPIFHDSVVSVIIEIDSLKHEKKIVKLITKGYVSDELVIDGIAIVKCLE